jgi:hypothetical protein
MWSLTGDGEKSEALHAGSLTEAPGPAVDAAREQRRGLGRQQYHLHVMRVC